MRKLLRNRILTIMIAIFAIVSNLLAPEVLSQMQARAGVMPMMAAMPLCHGGGGDGQKAPEGSTQQHACCKVCVCHPAASGLPSAPYLPATFPASRAMLNEAAPAGKVVVCFNNKSSPRGPPSFD